MRRYYSAAITVITLLAHLHAHTQTPTPPIPQLRVDTRLVVLDVVITDKSGKPVDNLTRDDFRIYEDKQFRPIRAFDTPAQHTLPAASSSDNQTLDPANAAAFGQSPVLILMLDQLNTHFADSSFARRELHDYLAAQPVTLPQPTTLIILYDNQSRQLQAPTRSREALLAALAAAPVHNAWTLEQNGNAEGGPLDRLQQSLEAVEQIAQQYARLPGRKNLLWVGGGFPTPDPTTIDGDDAREVHTMLQHITDLLLETHVTLYAVDPSSSAAGVTEITTEEQANFATAAGGMSSSIDPFNAQSDFDRLGPVTGGRVIRGRNDLHQQIDSAVSLGGHYYTLAYEPGGEAAPQYRHIRVECIRPGLTVSTRDGYYSPAAEHGINTDMMAEDLQSALRSSVPLNGLAVTVEPQQQNSQHQQQFILHVKAKDLTWLMNSDGTQFAHVEVVAAQFSAKGKLLDHKLQGMIANAKVGTQLSDPSHSADFAIAFPRATQAANIKFIVRDAGSGRMGSALIPAPTR